eukprot:TRINITY_DN14799_c0_g1_i1.p1 TRINITY_DN14799_c0_g1~~TRINITY_DN14799_c0_g1_i1.p1  ORF type:complete len:1430 (+),score=362.79 TRINITY_DN14799_c0_g1_i1:146-4435(+)
MGNAQGGKVDEERSFWRSDGNSRWQKFVELRSERRLEFGLRTFQSGRIVDHWSWGDIISVERLLLLPTNAPFTPPTPAGIRRIAPGNVVAYGLCIRSKNATATGRERAPSEVIFCTEKEKHRDNCYKQVWRALLEAKRRNLVPAEMRWATPSFNVFSNDVGRPSNAASERLSTGEAPDVRPRPSRVTFSPAAAIEESEEPAADPGPAALEAPSSETLAASEAGAAAVAEDTEAMPTTGEDEGASETAAATASSSAAEVEVVTQPTAGSSGKGHKGPPLPGAGGKGPPLPAPGGKGKGRGGKSKAKPEPESKPRGPKIQDVKLLPEDVKKKDTGIWGDVERIESEKDPDRQLDFDAFLPTEEQKREQALGKGKGKGGLSIFDMQTTTALGVYMHYLDMNALVDAVRRMDPEGLRSRLEHVAEFVNQMRLLEKTKNPLGVLRKEVELLMELGRDVSGLRAIPEQACVPLAMEREAIPLLELLVNYLKMEERVEEFQKQLDELSVTSEGLQESKTFQAIAYIMQEFVNWAGRQGLLPDGGAGVIHLGEQLVHMRKIRMPAVKGVPGNNLVYFVANTFEEWGKSLVENPLDADVPHLQMVVKTSPQRLRTTLEQLRKGQELAQEHLEKAETLAAEEAAARYAEENPPLEEGDGEEPPHGEAADAIPTAASLALGTRPLGTRPLGTRPLGTRPLGTRPLGTRPLGTRPVATGPVLFNLADDDDQDAPMVGADAEAKDLRETLPAVPEGPCPMPSKVPNLYKLRWMGRGTFTRAVAGGSLRMSMGGDGRPSSVGRASSGPFLRPSSAGFRVNLAAHHVWVVLPRRTRSGRAKHCRCWMEVRANHLVLREKSNRPTNTMETAVPLPGASLVLLEPASLNDLSDLSKWLVSLKVPGFELKTPWSEGAPLLIITATMEAAKAWEEKLALETRQFGVGRLWRQEKVVLGKWVKQWKPYYCHYEPLERRLEFFLDSFDRFGKEPKWTLPIEDVTYFPEDSSAGEEYRLCFHVVQDDGNGDSTLFRADNDLDMSGWFAVLDMASGKSGSFQRESDLFDRGARPSFGVQLLPPGGGAAASAQDARPGPRIVSLLESTAESATPSGSPSPLFESVISEGLGDSVVSSAGSAPSFVVTQGGTAPIPASFRLRPTKEERTMSGELLQAAARAVASIGEDSADDALAAAARAVAAVDEAGGDGDPLRASFASTVSVGSPSEADEAVGDEVVAEPAEVTTMAPPRVSLPPRSFQFRMSTSLPGGEGTAPAGGAAAANEEGPAGGESRHGGDEGSDDEGETPSFASSKMGDSGFEAPAEESEPEDPDLPEQLQNLRKIRRQFRDKAQRLNDERLAANEWCRYALDYFSEPYGPEADPLEAFHKFLEQVEQFRGDFEQERKKVLQEKERRAAAERRTAAQAARRASVLAGRAAAAKAVAPADAEVTVGS